MDGAEVDGAEVDGAEVDVAEVDGVEMIQDRVTSATLHLHVQVATNYTPITHHRLYYPPELSSVPIYRPQKDRQLGEPGHNVLT